MSKISITLNQKYKSFDDGFSTLLEGEIIVLSGINGSGKSQLINIIRGREQGGSPSQRSPIKSTIEIGQGGAGGASGIAGLNGGITSLYGPQLSIQANGGGGGGSNDAPGKQ